MGIKLEVGVFFLDKLTSLAISLLLIPAWIKVQLEDMSRVLFLFRGCLGLL